ncbi:mechanosensitive ion channel family protein [Aliikangiella sp. G2MR2-5]|uniref:mechanosensitive ion channel family protein n=1 Tax=Aliikangiella sp. G2MR2-5 TaxID=2788943 RepID=UPI0018A9713A|nr:mechanosensitive ion channel domain-containing protein [Aliikangiella sp. G2MR2-5]
MEKEIKQEIAQLQVIYDTIANFFVNYSFQLIGALLILIIGMLIAKKVSNGVNKLCIKKGIDVTLSRFISNIVKITIVVMVAIICLNKLGISITPLIAAIGAISLGAGLAVQGLLSNYGAGLNIVLTRPFIVGDTISVQGVSGIVKDILLAHTIIVTEDDVEITIPNKHIIGEIIHNSQENSLIELEVGVSYASNMDKVTQILLGAIQDNSFFDCKNDPQVGISSFGDSSVNFEVRVWVASNQLNAARFSLNKSIWDALKAEQIDIPFPQREVKIIAK